MWVDCAVLGALWGVRVKNLLGPHCVILQAALSVSVLLADYSGGFPGVQHFCSAVLISSGMFGSDHYDISSVGVLTWLQIDR